MSDGLIGYGSEFHLADENGALQLMGRLKEIDPGAPEWGTTDKTGFDSPNRTEEVMKTMKAPGTGKFMVYWLPGTLTDTRLRNAYADINPRAYKLIVPATTGTYEATGDVLVLSVKPAVPLKDVMTSEVNLQFTGERGDWAASA